MFMNDVKTSFKKDHVVDLASHEHDVCSVHIRTAIAKRKIFSSRREDQKIRLRYQSFRNTMKEVVLRLSFAGQLPKDTCITYKRKNKKDVNVRCM